jgi:serine/threonine protein kinase
MWRLLTPGEWRGLEVAIKTVIFQSGRHDNQTDLVASEAAIASNLVHRNIVSTFAHDIRAIAPTDGNELAVFKFYLIQQFCNGGTLRQALQKGYLSAHSVRRRWEVIVQLLRGVVSGMEYMHKQRICHGDLNPSNVLLKVGFAFLAAVHSRRTAGCFSTPKSTETVRIDLCFAARSTTLWLISRVLTNRMITKKNHTIVCVCIVWNRMIDRMGV